ncbi:MAG: homoserine dehydrogenase [Alphaproteobacteria bacterium]|nr:homoserine dehydrogenase [Alphaproteobacteria bacterium]
MATPLRIGIAGLGNVGASVFRLIKANSDILSARAGRDIVVTAVSARDKNRNRGLDLSGVSWHDDARALAADPNVDVVVELMGGAEGAAFDLVTGALKAGKNVVTANKALLASRGGEVLAYMGDGKGAIAFEAAVAGGIPVIKGLREGLAANRIHAIYGILNGTCNFILSTMTETGRDFDDVLAEAQQRGYAEADPSFDVDGVDAGHKLSILSGLAFGCVPDVKNIELKGIRGVSALDIAFAAELGYRIKLLGIARKTARGIEQSVEPCLVPQASPIAAVGGPLNAVYVDGDFVGKVLLMGAGAGGDATASAVVADIVDIARGQALPLMGVENDKVGALEPADIRAREGSFYLRFKVLDVPGVVADISAILRDDKVSLESVLQRGRDPGQPVQLIMTTHETREADMRHAVDKISALKSVMETPHMMRIEEFKG